jgi:flagellar biosynthesis protein FlhA
VARDTLLKDHVLNLQPYPEMNVVGSVETYEPVYGAQARWVPDRYVEELAISGGTVITPMEVLATHLLEIIKRNFSKLLTVRSVRRLLDERRGHPDATKAEEYNRLFDEYIPDKVPIDCLHSVLRLLLDERVSIRNIELIIEAVGEIRPHTASADMICEHVRQRLGFQIVSELKREDGSIPLLQLADEWEDTFQSYQVEGDRGLNVALPPDLFSRLTSQVAEKLEDVESDQSGTAIICNSRRRRFLRTVLRAKGLSNPVLSYEELGVDARPIILGTIGS